MKIGIVTETQAFENRVAATAESVKKLVGLGVEVLVEKGAGLRALIDDSAYIEAGAKLISKPKDVLGQADLVLKIQRPDPREITLIKSGAIVCAQMDPFDHDEALEAMAKAGLSTFAMELMPRITRAQSMDILSSQANLAGYKAVIEAASHYERALPMMMTAAGTVPAAKIFVMGAGVAGLQAIATARRLGAIVSATDVRPAAKEQVQSLGAKFIAVENEEFREAETAGGYAKAMSAQYQALQAELVASHIAKQDIVITTALIPGRQAPILVNKAMFSSMRKGSIIVDLAVERGGNVEGAQRDTIIDQEGVKIIGFSNMASRMAATASLLFAKNLLAFVETLIDKQNQAFKIDLDDVLVKATLLTHNGAIVHEQFAKESANA